jgi:hypothetical protein
MPSGASASLPRPGSRKGMGGNDGKRGSAARFPPATCRTSGVAFCATAQFRRGRPPRWHMPTPRYTGGLQSSRSTPNDLVAPMPDHSSESGALLEEIVCPHCWHRFPPEQMHFIAVSPTLAFDHRLGVGEYRRFLPSQFTVQGDAIDPAGGVCTETACPECHLKVPRVMATRRTLALSVFGSPSSSKSYLLTSMTNQVEQLSDKFRLAFDDADSEANVIVRDYQSQLFRAPTPDTKVRLLKTDLEGDWYTRVSFGKRSKLLPKPFLFKVDAMRGHPAHHASSAVGRILRIYDNAGESFEPGMEKEESPVTRHMAQADGLLFVFDPTQENSFRDACRSRSDDPQWRDSRMSQQQTLFSEAMRRIQRFAGSSDTEPVRKPLIVVIAKYDSWSFLAETEQLPTPWRLKSGGQDGEERLAFDLECVRRVSRDFRALLAKHAAPMLARIETTCTPENTLFVPASSTGCSPSGKDDQGYYHLAGNIKPIWSEVPLLAIMHLCAPDLVDGLGL